MSSFLGTAADFSYFSFMDVLLEIDYQTCQFSQSVNASLKNMDLYRQEFI